MGREVKRVSTDFDWPLREVWTGYLYPDEFDENPCPAGEACLNGKTSARRPMTIEQARGFVETGWAPSFIGNAGGVHDGATYIGTDKAMGQ